jgi:hypothetical protein
MAPMGTCGMIFGVPIFVRTETQTGANAAAEFPQLFNFTGSTCGETVISVSIKTVWIREDQNT